MSQPVNPRPATPRPPQPPPDEPGWPGPAPDDPQPDPPNPFAATDWRMFFYAWTGFALRVFLIFGAAFSAWQYLEAREEKRVERTLALLELWGDPQYQDAQRALRRRVGALQTQFSAVMGTQPTSAEADVIRDQIGIKAMSADGGSMPLPNFEEHFDRIVFFLNRVAFCVEENLCSRDVADANFLDFANSFWSTFAGYVERERRRGTPTFARPIEGYITRPGGPAPVRS